MKNILIIIFLFLSSIVFAKDDLDDALIEEITDGIGTLSFKLHTDIKANKVDVDGEEVSLINFLKEWDSFNNYTRYGELLVNLYGIEGFEGDSVFIIVNNKTNIIEAIEKITFTKKGTLELFTEDKYHPIEVGNTMVEMFEKHLLDLDYKEISSSTINFEDYNKQGKRVILKKNNIVVLLEATYQNYFDDTPMGGVFTLITSKSHFEENKSYYEEMLKF